MSAGTMMPTRQAWVDAFWANHTANHMRELTHREIERAMTLYEWGASPLMALAILHLLRIKPAQSDG